jgi:formylglycine-generating enzyme required for sulfatase activity
MGNQTGGDVQWYEAGDDKVRIQFLDGKWQSIEAYKQHPATEITWFGAEAFCEWRGGRLPTEAEWEKAARWNPATNDVSVYPWGPTQPTGEQANYALTGNNTRPVGTFEAGKSPLGVYDMAGNVFEWVADWYAPGGYGTADPVNEPTGPAQGTTKIIKGGSWWDNAFYLRGANRGTMLPTFAVNYVGFRCVKETGSVAP